MWSRPARGRRGSGRATSNRRVRGRRPARVASVERTEIPGVFTFTPSRAARGSPRRGARASVLLLLAAALPARAQPLSPEPFPWQDAAPVAVPFLQLPFESPATVSPGRLRLG